MKHFLHISNTDILADSRIQKQLASLSRIDNAFVYSIGLASASRPCSTDTRIANYHPLFLITHSLWILPRPIRYFFQLIEFTIRVVLYVGSSRNRPNIVHCHDTFALPAGWLIKTFFGCRLVYDAHELESNKNGQGLMLSKATFIIEWFCWSKIDLLVSVSNSILEWYQANLGTKQSVLVLNSPVTNSTLSPTIYSSHSSYLSDTFGIPSNVPIFVYSGLFSRGRGIECCLNAFRSLGQSAHVVFIGFGELASLIKKDSNYFPNIHLHPPVSHDKVVSVVSSADIGLCLIENCSLSDHLCLPNKLFEYCTAGLQVLASNIPEVRLLLEKYELGLCCDLNEVSVKESILSMISEYPIQRSSIPYELSWEAQATKLNDIYIRLLKPSP